MKKLTSLTCAALCAAVCSSASATNVVWNDATGDHQWGTAENWSPVGVPQAGDNVTIYEKGSEIVVDNDSALSFATVASITHRATTPITYIAIEATTNLHLRCTMTGYSSIHLKTAIDLIVEPENNAGTNFTGFHILDKGRFLFPNVKPDSGNYQFGRFDVAPDAALVIRNNTMHQFYRLYCRGLFTNETTKTTLRISLPSDPDSYISGPIGGIWDFNTPTTLHITGTNNTMTGQIDPYNKCTFGIAKFGKKSEATSSIGSIQSVSPAYYGCRILYEGQGEETDKTLYIAGSTTFEQELDAGETGGLVWAGDFGYGSGGYSSQMQRFVFSGTGLQTNVFSGAWAALSAGCSTYVAKCGPSIWRFNSNANRRNAGVIAVEEGTLQFESIAEQGDVCSLGTADNLNERYSGAIDASRTVDYACLLGTTNETGSASTTGTLEYVGSVRGTCTTRPFRLLGDGCLSTPCGALSIADVSALTAGRKTLTLSAGAAVSSALQNVRDGAGTVSLVKEGEGTWTLDGASDITGAIDVKAGTLVFSGTHRPYEYYRFTVMGTPAGETNTYAYCFQAYYDELAFFDAEGKRLNPSMTWNPAEHPKAGFDTVSGDALELEPNEIAAGKAGSTYFYANNAYGLNYLCNNAAAAGQTQIYIAMWNSQSAKMAPQLAKPETWMPVILRLPAEAIGKAVKYDFLGSYADHTPGNVQDGTPCSFKLEGSADGCHWTELSRRENYFGPGTKKSWYSDGTTFAKNVAPTGFPIATATTNALPLAHFAGAVRVASGATLKVLGDVTPISHLTVDADGTGLLDGVPFAANGTLDIVSSGELSDGVVAMNIVNSTTAANLANWNVTVNGAANARYILTPSASGIEVRRHGMILIFK